MTDQRRHYSAEQRSEAVGLALSVGVKEAGRRLKVPYRTVSHWMARPDAQSMIVTSRESLAETLKAGAAEGAAALLAIVRSPAAADRDKVRAAEVLLERWQLASGGPTAINANVNVNASADSMTVYQRAEMAAYVQSLLDKLDGGEPDQVDAVEASVSLIVQSQREMSALVDSGEAADVDAAHALLERRYSDVG